MDNLAGWELTVRLSWLASKLQVPYLHFPRAEITSTHHHAWHFYMGFGDHLRAPGLHDKPFTNSVLSFFLSADRVHVYVSELVIGTSYLCPTLAFLSTGQLTRSSTQANEVC